MQPESINTVGKHVASWSFVIGSLFMLFYYVTSDSVIDFAAYGFILLAFIVNLVVFFILAIKCFNDSKNNKPYIRTMRLMLLNIPIVIIYLWFVFVLMDTMRITFVNETGKPINRIEIVGCGGGYIDSLGIDEREVEWVSITGDCGLTISYWIDGKQKQEVIENYITTSNGQKVVYKIGASGRNTFE